MRCLSVVEAATALATTGFNVTSNAGRNSLGLRSDIASPQTRVEASPPIANRLSDFAAALIQWHTSDRERLVWMESWNDLPPSQYAFVIAARNGLGESRSLSEAPGHYFDAHPYREQDQLAISPQHAKELSHMVGFVAAMVINEWDGWLVAVDSSDRIEFWEGNVLFYSSDHAQLASARSMIGLFGCDLKLR
jgi:hypothetical protein